MPGRSNVPEGIEVEDLGTKLRITRRPSRKYGVILAVFALLWTGCPIGFLLTSESPDPLLMVFGVVGLGLAYLALIMLVNSTEIQINQQELVVQQGPLPWPGVGKKTLTISDIRQFSCLYVDNLEEQQDGRWSSVRSRTSYSWDLLATGPEGRRVSLIRVDQASHASFLEKELQRFLDTRVLPAREKARPVVAQEPTPQPAVDEPRPDLEAALAEMDELVPDLGQTADDS